MDLAATAATVIARARANSGLTTPEFDMQIANDGIGGFYAPLGSEVYALANEHLPPVEPGRDNRLDERETNGKALFEQLRPELEAYVQKCRTRQYSGWSNAARARGARLHYAS